MEKDNMEVEVKYQVDQEKFRMIKGVICNHANIIGQSDQTDFYYSPKDFSYYDNGDRCLRVRSEKGRHILSYKQIHEDSDYIEEYETSVGNLSLINLILKSIGFRCEMVIKKKREEYQYNNSIVVALDKVEGLGYFVEIEDKTKDSLDVRREHINEVVHMLSLEDKKINTEGYSNMMFSQKKKED